MALHNPKRKVAPSGSWDSGQLSAWARDVSYKGSPKHKRNPHLYGLVVNSIEPDGTKCEGVGTFESPEGAYDKARALLVSGILRGVVSPQLRGSWPHYVWAVSDDQQYVFEAELTNQSSGEYHGYPLEADDLFRGVVLDEWPSRRPA